MQCDVSAFVASKMMLGASPEQSLCHKLSSCKPYKLNHHVSLISLIKLKASWQPELNAALIQQTVQLLA